jgi:carboxymethylenebutenolidase
MKKVFVSFAVLYSLIFVNAQDYALQQLENSPRHHEWVNISNGDRNVHCFVAYPEKPGSTTAVIIIHENRGLNDWARSFADQIAAAGYLAIAPDLLSDFDDVHSRTTDFENSDAARDAIYKLDPGQVTEDLKKVIDYAKTAPASTGKVVVSGFCWGGSQSFRIATQSQDIAAAMVFYGSAPTEHEEFQNIVVPVYGFYAENDQRINEGIPAAEKIMKELGKTYDYEIYPGAGHAFMRRGDDPEIHDDNTIARNKSWERIRSILQKIEKD